VSKDEELDIEEEFSFSREPLDFARQDLDTSLKKRLIMWAIRWIIGFVIIWLITAYYPQASWLWLVGIVTASAFLVFVLAGSWMLKRRFEMAETRISRAEQEIRELERSELENFDDPS